MLSLHAVELASELRVLEPELVEANLFVTHFIAHVRLFHDWRASLAKPGYSAAPIMRGLRTAEALSRSHLIRVRPSMVNRSVVTSALRCFAAYESLLNRSLQAMHLLLLQRRLESRYVEEEMRVPGIGSHLFLQARIETQILHHVLVLCACLMRRTDA